jgi:hypothetical protein
LLCPKLRHNLPSPLFLTQCHADHFNERVGAERQLVEQPVIHEAGGERVATLAKNGSTFRMRRNPTAAHLHQDLQRAESGKLRQPTQQIARAKHRRKTPTEHPPQSWHGAQQTARAASETLLAGGPLLCPTKRVRLPKRQALRCLETRIAGSVHSAEIRMWLPKSLPGSTTWATAAQTKVKRDHVKRGVKEQDEYKQRLVHGQHRPSTPKVDERLHQQTTTQPSTMATRYRAVGMDASRPSTGSQFFSFAIGCSRSVAGNRDQQAEIPTPMCVNRRRATSSCTAAQRSVPQKTSDLSEFLSATRLMCDTRQGMLGYGLPGRRFAPELSVDARRQ